MRNWTVDPDSLAQYVQGIAGDASTVDWFRLRRIAEDLALRPSFDRLMTLDHNTIKELPHQIKVAEQALLRPMAGRAILADEVGLGKTIEAGIILKELAARGLARRVLILTPAALVEQWHAELETKFFEDFRMPHAPGDWRKMPKAIASHSRARSKKHQAAILEHRWDLLIVDEAHKAKRHTTQFYKLLQRIERNFILLLTATPLQNDLRELYNLVTLLRPGQLGTWREFQERFVARGDARRVSNPEGLKDLTAEVMIRTRRANVSDSVRLPPRTPVHPRVQLTEPEAELYKEMVLFLRDLYRRGFHKRTETESRQDLVRKRRRTGRGIHALERMRLCQRLCSSARALSFSLRKIAEGELMLPDYRRRALELADAARSVQQHAKLEALTRVLEESPDRVLVFSEHRPTVKLIIQHVRQTGRPVREFSGDVSRPRRSRNLADFKRFDDAVFVATRAGTEGLNLQFCNRMVNYELPWNPMIVEQRIGRIHRIGQTRETFITNLAAEGTIEERVLQLLHEKIRLFELVVGELDVILGDFGGAEKLEKRLVDAWIDADDDDSFEQSLQQIGAAIEESRLAGLEQEERNSEVVAEDGAMRVEREFRSLSIPGRVRLAYGTSQLALARGVEARRHQLGLHVVEILDMLSGSPVVDTAGLHPDFGPLRRIVGVTGRGREIVLTVQADRLPMTLVELSADAEAPLLPV
jgi:SNF2 family DNA or RNA helicase